MGPHLLLTYDFPPDAESDAHLPNRVDRLSLPSTRLRSLPGLLRWTRRASELARQQEVGFAWCGNIKPALYPARWLRVRSGIPTGLFVYGMDLLLLREQTRRSAFKRRAARSLLRDVAVVAAISHWTAALCGSVLEEIGLPPSAGLIQVVPLGTDPVIFHPGIDTAAIRQRHHLPAGRWLLTVARLTAHKGIDTGIRVLAMLAGEFPELRYAVVGSGADRAELEALAARLGVGDRFRILSGIPDRELPAFYNLAEVYLGLSRQSERAVEGFGISLVEAAACGVPVVAGRTGGIPDAVREGESACLVDPDDPEVIASTVRALLQDPAERHRLNWDRVARELCALGDALSRDGAPHPRGGR